MSAKEIVPTAAAAVVRRLDRTQIPKPDALSIEAQCYPEFFKRAETWTAEMPKRRGVAKACFENAYAEYKQHPDDYKIYFGYGLKSFGGFAMPTDHAWCVHGDKVIDPTWDGPVTYVGVPVVNVDAYRELIDGMAVGVSMVMSNAPLRKSIFGF